MIKNPKVGMRVKVLNPGCCGEAVYESPYGVIGVVDTSDEADDRYTYIIQVRMDAHLNATWWHSEHCLEEVQEASFPLPCSCHTPEDQVCEKEDDIEYIEVPVLRDFDFKDQVGTLRVRKGALPTKPDFVFSIGYRHKHILKSEDDSYVLKCVSICHDDDYVKYVEYEKGGANV